MDIETLKKALLLAWCSETALGEWSPECPSQNQCAVTALIVQDYYGGDMLRCKMSSGDSHYWNRLPNGTEEDTTEPQFEFIHDWPDKSNYIIRTRDYVLSFPSTVIRYNLLKSRVEAALKDLSTD